MKHCLLVVLLLAFVSLDTYAQYAPNDSLALRKSSRQGKILTGTGDVLYLTGASLAVLGGVMLATPTLIYLHKYHQYPDANAFKDRNTVPMEDAGAAVMAVGIPLFLVGIPFSVAGALKEGTSAFSNDGQKGWGAILETSLVRQPVRVIAGYHGSENLFGGVGAGMFLYDSPLPVLFGTARWSMFDSAVSPCLGIEAGIIPGAGTSMNNFYYGMDAGCRFRFSPGKPQSLLVALSLTEMPDHKTMLPGNLALKLGWIF